MNNFKFFKGNKTTVLDDDWYRNYQPYVPGRQDPPEGMSYRHWNILPQDLRGGERENMELYIEGWEAARHNNYNNPYPDRLRGEVWNRGWHACWARRNRETEPINTNPYWGEVREYIRTIFDNEPQHHGFYVGVNRTQLVLEYQGDMDIESVRAEVHSLQYRYANYVSINEQVIGFMEDYLNEHLNGTSRIRLT